MTNEEFKTLAAKCQDGTATKAEKEAFNRAYQLLATRYTEWDNELMGNEETVKSKLYSSVTAKIAITQRRGRIRRLHMYAAAAVILVFLSAGIYRLLHAPSQLNQAAHNQTNDLKPGENRATLTLANGQKIVLTKDLVGQLSRQGNVNVSMKPNGTVAYTAGSGGQKINAGTAYNTLTTKKGEQFPLVLSDGTQVILDAASSITFPVSFTGKQRVVSITGQAYFKVVHNEHQPFQVLVKGQKIRDIGTEFNINAYDDEGVVKTTLLEGSVKVSTANKAVVLMPGEQSQVAGDINTITVVKNADIQSIVAWKNGLFQYNNASIQEVMRQIARWYNVDIAYEGAIPQREFSGKMQRDLNASQVLDLLSFTRIHFKIEGKKIIVTP
ncbi:FecR family protein [Mucilaginibacter sp. Mucisp86]|uniref:FecR family protein n=1 Tax=Mucilaginibacter sp. Mucisp86 TaxID=3243060 RepID=UPI0039B37C8B